MTVSNPFSNEKIRKITAIKKINVTVVMFMVCRDVFSVPHRMDNMIVRGEEYDSLSWPIYEEIIAASFTIIHFHLIIDNR